MDDRSRVAELLGREPQGPFAVVVRHDDGDPVVIANAPMLDDGTPMPTRFWLVGAREVAEVSRLESEGGVRRAEAEVDAAELADAHRRYAEHRDELLPPGSDGPRPSGGVGGTRTGVKCLHAHYAWHLAGGDDPVGRWVAEELAARTPPVASTGQDAVPQHPTPAMMRIDVGAESSVVELDDGSRYEAAFGVRALAGDELEGSDPPAPEQLTNALGAVADRFEEVILQRPDIVNVTDVQLGGAEMRTVAHVEAGADDVEFPYALGRGDAEEVFRLLATETAADRTHNPGLAADQVDVVVASCCVVLAVMRRLSLEAVAIS
ncbi:MAG: DUF501 domain-containing protein [Acidimicrobiia bacterium]|nr:DUF501 domain-containing protein [Acidimicrobiia bacterium]